MQLYVALEKATVNKQKLQEKNSTRKYNFAHLYMMLPVAYETLTFQTMTAAKASALAVVSEQPSLHTPLGLAPLILHINHFCCVNRRKTGEDMSEASGGKRTDEHTWNARKHDGHTLYRAAVIIARFRCLSSSSNRVITAVQATSLTGANLVLLSIRAYACLAQQHTCCRRASSLSR